jgi:hypothetical protein
LPTKERVVVEKAINSISVKLDNLQQRLQTYKESNRNIIIEESEGALDTSNRMRISRFNNDSSQRSAMNIKEGELDENGKTIIFERLSSVSSQSKL